MGIWRSPSWGCVPKSNGAHGEGVIEGGVYSGWGEKSLKDGVHTGENDEKHQGM